MNARIQGALGVTPEQAAKVIPLLVPVVLRFLMRRVIVQEFFQRAHAVQHFIGRRWHESRLSRTTAANPFLTSPERSRALIFAPSAGQQFVVGLANQSQR